MKRRGFLAALAALVAAPWLPKPEPRMALLPFEGIDDYLTEVYGSDGKEFWILEADGSYSVYPVQKSVLRSLR